MMGQGTMGEMGVMTGYGMFFGMLIWILVIAGVVALVVWAVQKPGKTDSAAVQETALDILKKRYARGEIDKEEYEEKKTALQ